MYPIKPMLPLHVFLNMRLGHLFQNNRKNMGELCKQISWQVPGRSAERLGAAKRAFQKTPFLKSLPVFIILKVVSRERFTSKNSNSGLKA